LNTLNSALFSSISFRGLELKNRIMVSPMCQYSAADGCMTDWHLMHLGQLSVSGAGILMTEMTNVEPVGRISPNCLGLYSDDNETAAKKVIDSCDKFGKIPVGVQLAHAGRKASTKPPWDDRKYISSDEGGWQPVGPSAIASSDRSPKPRELTPGEISGLVDAFAQSAERARRIGFAAIEIHAAHGYLLHQFLSPLSNQRSDHYGGSLENRMRFPLEVFAAVREQWPDSKPIGVRISATDWVSGGWDIGDSVEFARELKALGCDWIDVSSGGLVQHLDVVAKPGYQVPLAAQIRHRAKIPTIAVGLITQAAQAEEIIRSKSADVVALARTMLYNPRWPWHAAKELGASIEYPQQYLRCLPVFA